MTHFTQFFTKNSCFRSFAHPLTRWMSLRLFLFSKCVGKRLAVTAAEMYAIPTNPCWGKSGRKWRANMDDESCGVWTWLSEWCCARWRHVVDQLSLLSPSRLSSLTRNLAQRTLSCQHYAHQHGQTNETSNENDTQLYRWRGSSEFPWYYVVVLS